MTDSSQAPSAGSSGASRRLVMLAGDALSGEACRTFIFKGESHTLGNALKNVILQNPAVTFCGYSIPHPAEDQVRHCMSVDDDEFLVCHSLSRFLQMYLRIQTIEGTTAQDALRRGFKDLKAICQATRTVFKDALDK